MRRMFSEKQIQEMISKGIEKSIGRFYVRVECRELKLIDEDENLHEISSFIFYTNIKPSDDMAVEDYITAMLDGNPIIVTTYDDDLGSLSLLPLHFDDGYVYVGEDKIVTFDTVDLHITDLSSGQYFSLQI